MKVELGKILLMKSKICNLKGNDIRSYSVMLSIFLCTILIGTGAIAQENILLQKVTNGLLSMDPNRKILFVNNLGSALNNASPEQLLFFQNVLSSTLESNAEKPFTLPYNPPAFDPINISGLNILNYENLKSDCLNLQKKEELKIRGEMLNHRIRELENTGVHPGQAWEKAREEYKSRRKKEFKKKILKGQDVGLSNKQNVAPVLKHNFSIISLESFDNELYMEAYMEMAASGQIPGYSDSNQSNQKEFKSFYDGLYTLTGPGDFSQKFNRGGESNVRLRKGQKETIYVREGDVIIKDPPSLGD